MGFNEKSLTLMRLFRQVKHPVLVLRFTSFGLEPCREALYIKCAASVDEGSGMRASGMEYGVWML